MSEQHTVLLKHEGIEFKDAVIYMSGHAYIGCTFERCTMVYRYPAAGLMTECQFNGCNWEINASVHDRKQAEAVIESLNSWVYPSLPRLGNPES